MVYLTVQLLQDCCIEEQKILEEGSFELLYPHVRETMMILSEQKKISLSVTDSCVDFITEKGYSREFGARNITRTIEDMIANALVDEVLFGKLENGGNVTADTDNKIIIFNYDN